MVLLMDNAQEIHWTRFGQWIRSQRRGNLGLTATEAARVAGITLTQWSRIENGASGTARNRIPGIARAIGADLRETYERAGFLPPVYSEDVRESVSEYPAVAPELESIKAAVREVLAESVIDSEFPESIPLYSQLTPRNRKVADRQIRGILEALRSAQDDSE